jgi:hypothetical protein
MTFLLELCLSMGVSTRRKNEIIFVSMKRMNEATRYLLRRHDFSE